MLKKDVIKQKILEYVNNIPLQLNDEQLITKLKLKKLLFDYDHTNECLNHVPNELDINKLNCTKICKGCSYCHKINCFI